MIGVLPRQVMPLVAWHLGRLELGSSQAHYWLTSDARKLHPTSGVHGVLGRLAPGVSPEEANPELPNHHRAKNEAQELEDLRCGYERVMVVRAAAAALLKERGHDVSQLVLGH